VRPPVNQEDFMPAVKTDEYALLIPRQEITFGQWLLLISKRLAMIKPHLDQFTLEKLGDFQFEYFGTSKYRLNRLKELSVTIKGSDNLLDKQGLFFQVPQNFSQQWNLDKMIATHSVWGFMRDEKLILITITFEITHYEKTEGKAYGALGHVIDITIEESTLQKILDHYPMTIDDNQNTGLHFLWWNLSDKVNEYVQKRKLLYNRALELFEQFDRQDFVMQHAQILVDSNDN
jgi:hypothetical protein